MTAAPPAINITDNDVGTIVLVATDNGATEAPGNTGAFTVRLGLQPSAAAAVTIGTSPQCNFAAASLTFTQANWNSDQTVVVTPIDDAVAEGAHGCSPSVISAANGGYNGVVATPPSINIADNDTSGITVSGGPLTVTEAWSSQSFTVVLASQPTGDVTVPLAASNLAEASVSPVSLTFTSANWSTAQSVTVTGVNDAIDDGEKSLTGRLADWTHSADIEKGFTLHGLRKTLGKRLAEGGASTRQLMDVLGHDDIEHAELYSREAEQIRLATEGTDKVVNLVRRS